MSSPTTSFEMGSLDEKLVPVTTDTLLLKDTADSNLLKEVQIINLDVAAIIPFTWASSDEDSPLSLGVLYTTEAASATRTIANVILSVKNAPTGSIITVDILKETTVNSNLFASIFSVLPTIDIDEFTSQTAVTPPVISTSTWNVQTRLQIVLTINDSNFIASGLKVTVV